MWSHYRYVMGNSDASQWANSWALYVLDLRHQLPGREVTSERVEVRC
jgi:hypothetical protein